MADTSKDELTRKAYEEIMAESKRASEIADKIGVEGWKRRELKPNKRFLQTTLIGSLRSNNRSARSCDLSLAESSAKRRKSNTDGEKCTARDSAASSSSNKRKDASKSNKLKKRTSEKDGREDHQKDKCHES